MWTVTTAAISMPQLKRKPVRRMKNLLQIEPPDFAKLPDFGLYWRWSDEQHSVLAAEELRRIRPLTVDAARRAWEAVESLTPESTEPAFASDIVVTTWLRDHLPAAVVPVIVSWSPELAVLSDSELFVQRWDDFCYPSSDDVSVFPPDISWLLEFRHDEHFTFWRPIPSNKR